jgi:hypothetical protein
MEKFSEDKKSYLLVLVENKIQVGNRTMIDRKWIKAKEEVDLGSLKNPNSKIIEFRYDSE